MNQKGLAPILIVLILAALIGGYFIFQNQPKPTTSSQQTPSTNSEQAIQPSPTADPTANWKTYIVGEITFKYPPTWSSKKLESAVGNQETVGFKKDKLSGYEKYPGDFNFTIILTEKLPDEILSQDKKSIPNIIESKLNLSNTPAIKLVWGNNQGVEVILRHVNTTYILMGNYIDNTFDQILSTFKFIK